MVRKIEEDLLPDAGNQGQIRHQTFQESMIENTTNLCSKMLSLESGSNLSKGFTGIKDCRGLVIRFDDVSHGANS